jgi:hypothetical protein
MGLRERFRSFFGSSATSDATAEDSAESTLWQATYDARQSYFETAVGPLPGDILKMLNMMGVWPGGGLFVIPARQLGADLCVYTTFGFTNTDMPTGVRMADFQLDEDGKRVTQAAGTLQKKARAAQKSGAAGYGYEFLVIANGGLEWPLGLLQWAVNAEIGHDAGLLARVEKYDGLTVERIDVPGGPVNVLIAKARAPLPTGTQLPNGTMELLVATTITDEEMQWSMTNGRGALLNKLCDAGVGQISTPGRPSAVR